MVLLLLILAALSPPVRATITPGTISFGTGHSLGQTIGNLNGLYFSTDSSNGWQYAPSSDLGSAVTNPDGDAAYTNVGYGGTPAIITSTTSGDRFYISSLKIWSWYANTSMTVTGYRNSQLVATQVLTLTAGSTGYVTFSLTDMMNLDEIRFDADKDYDYAIDDLVVAAAPTVTTKAASSVTYALINCVIPEGAASLLKGTD